MQEKIHQSLNPPELGPCVCSQVRRIARKLSSLYDAVLSPEELTITQYSLLANIDRASQLSHAVLARKVGMERTTLTRNLRPLIRAKWVAATTGEGSPATFASVNSSGKAEAGSVPLVRPHPRKVMRLPRSYR